MQFDDKMITVDTHLGPLRVRVTGGALHVLWDADVGSQDERGLIEDNRTMIERIARRKFTAKEMLVGGFVDIIDLDVED